MNLCKKYKENPIVINAVASHHGDEEPESLIACLVQAADAISAARPGARSETLESYTTRLKQLEEIADYFQGVDKTFAIQAGREIRVMVVPEQISDDDMVLLARDISKQIEENLEYPGQIKVNVIRESRVVDYAFSNGNTEEWDFIHHDGAAAVIPVMEDGKILMVKQYRNALERDTLEIPELKTG